ncbi:hypothetical protein EVAR_96201_1 [Eumeta japonica]|uniref:Uncharacterized protein n=1 Tax=Eumeta variegata TaxID=151549 RepID=A0A4C1VJ33_EUMVA|nr:hypothetical protein EVAR_96201_1 [Eumeta japonica]
MGLTLNSNTISGDELVNIIVSRDEVLKKIKQLDKNKGHKPDGVPAFLVQRRSSESHIRGSRTPIAIEVTEPCCGQLSCNTKVGLSTVNESSGDPLPSTDILYKKPAMQWWLLWGCESSRTTVTIYFLVARIFVYDDISAQQNLVLRIN